MKIVDLKPTFLLDADSETEVIYIGRSKATSNGVFYTKSKMVHIDFHGNPINEAIRINSIRYGDLLNKESIEVLPFGQFDVDNLLLVKGYLYFRKITDQDKDGNLTNDYEGGEIWRIDLNNFTLNFCYSLGEYNFHGFKAASDRYVIFLSEDRLPDDVTEIVLIDLLNNLETVLYNDNDNYNSFDYHIVTDEYSRPTGLLLKKWISEGEKSTSSNALYCCEWNDLMNQLHWKNINN